MISISLNIKQLEDRFLQEEENYVLNLHEKFQNAWNEISLGETIISQTAAFFNTGSNSMPPQVFQIVHMQIRYVHYKRNIYEGWRGDYNPHACLFVMEVPVLDLITGPGLLSKYV